MWSPSLTVRPQASRPATPRSSSLRFSHGLAGATTATVSPSRRRRGLRGGSSAAVIEGSYEEARRRVRFEQDRTVDRESLDLAGRWRHAVDDELRQDPAEDRRELVAVGGGEDDMDAGHVWQAVDDEIAVGRERVEAGLCHDLRTEVLRQVGGEEVRQAAEPDLVALEGPRRRRDLVAADVLRGLR